jgi:large subunit ribosomal protein L25
MDVSLTAVKGRSTGTRPSKRLRAEGQIPGVVYGLGKDPVAVTVPWPELRQALTTEAGLNALITLDVEGDSNLTIVKSLQRDPVRRDVVHVDFIRIDPDADIEVEVPVVLEGEAKALTNEGGLVDQLLHSLTIKAKPGRIPTELTVDISDLTLDEAIKVSDITLPDGVRTEVDGDDPVATGYVPRVEVEAEPVEGEEGEVAEGEQPAGEGEAKAEGGEAPEASADSGDSGE